MINLKHLPNQGRDEKTVLFLRRHWIEIVRMAAYFIALMLVPLALSYVLNLAGADIVMHPFWGPISDILLTVYTLTVILITLTQFTDYYLDTWIVTNERIINIEQKGLFSRVVAELHLNHVQDVTSETRGVLATILSYGDVHIQTAGTRERFFFKQIDNPDDVKRIISRLVEDDKRRHGDASGVTTPVFSENLDNTNNG